MNMYTVLSTGENRTNVMKKIVEVYIIIKFRSEP